MDGGATEITSKIGSLFPGGGAAMCQKQAIRYLTSETHATATVLPLRNCPRPHSTGPQRSACRNIRVDGRIHHASLDRIASHGNGNINCHFNPITPTLVGRNTRTPQTGFSFLYYFIFFLA